MTQATIACSQSEGKAAHLIILENYLENVSSHSHQRRRKPKCIEGRLVYFRITANGILVLAISRGCLQHCSSGTSIFKVPHITFMDQGNVAEDRSKVESRCKIDRRGKNRETNDNSQMVAIGIQQLFLCNDPIQTCSISALCYAKTWTS